MVLLLIQMITFFKALFIMLNKQAISTVTAHCLVKDGFVVMHLGKAEKLALRKKLSCI